MTTEKRTISVFVVVFAVKGHPARVGAVYTEENRAVDEVCRLHESSTAVTAWYAERQMELA